MFGFKDAEEEEEEEEEEGVMTDFRQLVDDEEADEEEVGVIIDLRVELAASAQVCWGVSLPKPSL